MKRTYPSIKGWKAHLDITLNPYQGLKQATLQEEIAITGLDITLNPYQGLKRDLEGQFAGNHPRYHLKSLSGIETQTELNTLRELKHPLDITLNPYQGLKQQITRAWHCYCPNSISP